ncbi:MAG: glycosyltransferase, partial [Acidobacteria bacterium]|nr:glycosyltransferase [Acidobacteriota bacterium]
MRKYDLLLVQREAMFFGPAFFERLFQQIGKTPLILDLDDATYVSYVSPTYGKLGSFFKFFGKTDNLINRADAVICGNRFIAEYVEKKGTKAIVVPTVVDTDKFVPIEKNNEVTIVGWIGTPSTFPLLQSVFPVLQKLAQEYQFILRIVGAGVEKIEIEGVKIENLSWNLEREIADFQSLDIGVYPITTAASLPSNWIVGKSGFKAIQYMAVGIPFVMSPIGVCAEIGEPGVTHFNAESAKGWYNALDKLFSDVDLRKRMGAEARKHCLENYSLAIQTEKLARTFKKVLNFV